MTIVLNEQEWAEDMLKTHSLGKKPFETLYRVAKYYLNKNYTKKETRNLLGIFLLQCDPMASIPKWDETLDRAVAKALKSSQLKIDYITVTVPEMEIIDSLNGIQLKRLAFTLLCLSKYWRAVNPDCDGWINNKDSDIMKMANINTSIKRQSSMYRELNLLGMIQFSKKIDNTNVKVCFACDGESALDIADYRNLGYQYLLHKGSKNHFRCQNCGLVVRKNNIAKDMYPSITGRPQKYCKECAISVNIHKNVDNVMKIKK